MKRSSFASQAVFCAIVISLFYQPASFGDTVPSEPAITKEPTQKRGDKAPNIPTLVANPQPVPLSAISPRSNWVLGGEFAPGISAVTYQGQMQYQPLFLFQAHVGYDFTNHQCFTEEKKDSLFCTEALILLQTGGGFLATSQIPFFRATLGFEFDFYFGTQRTVAFTLKWRMGYGRYGLRSNDDQASLEMPFQIPETESKNRLEWGIGPGILIHLDRFSKKTEGLSLYSDVHFVSPLLSWGLVFSIGAQYRF